MKPALTVAFVIVGIIILVGVFAVFQFNPSAIAEPGRTETYLATEAKHFLVRRTSHAAILPPADLQASIAGADILYGLECGACHRLNGPKEMNLGEWMYPRATDLTSPEAQRYSDRELFWIVKNGIRMSGMPAFGKVETDSHIWKLVHYLRTLPAKADAD
jgi:mono/diheme cytochrome c family protein